MRDAVHGPVVHSAVEIVKHQHGRIAGARNNASARGSDADSAAKLCASSRISDRLSSTTRDGLIRSNASKMRRSSRPVRGPTNRAGSAAALRRAGSRAEPVRTYRNSGEGPAVRFGAIAQLLLGFRQGDIEHRVRPLRRRRRNWLAIVVLPVPGLPSSRNSRPRARPPARISSSPETPVAQLLIDPRHAVCYGGKDYQRAEWFPLIRINRAIDRPVMP
jgi:hypothetical protein